MDMRPESARAKVQGAIDSHARTAACWPTTLQTPQRLPKPPFLPGILPLPPDSNAAHVDNPHMATTIAAALSHEGLPPVWREDARILILGSFPGVASLAARAYYAHPRNQFWPIIERLTGQPLTALPYPERLDALRSHRLALWDTVGRCQRNGSLDSAIRDALTNEFAPLLARLPQLALVAFNGQHAARQRRFFEEQGYATVVLPSTSPAYASLTGAQKTERWLAALRPVLDGGAPPPAGGPKA